ncbi:Hsp70 family protein [Parasediminibacterium paludis]|uniref:Hsp70 family protein n=1 Tax=Parasediminibacterium paludis TaxID=908966 RepID=A0ABV8PXG2_9BACT
MRTKIDYGIDLGTTNSAIARIENGKAIIKKSDTLKDTIPSCVSVNKKQDILVGDPAYNTLKMDKLRALKSQKQESTNSYLEFKRTMGTDTSYYSSNMNRNFSSEELSAEVVMKLKSFITDESIKSIVITVPAKFTMVQKDATIKAGKLAGFEHIELLQEPIAASMAYGIDAVNKDGIWLVFDFGGGTFDAALVKVEDGIMKVIDTEGDNWLGGKNIDEAILDEIILPYLESNFSINDILSDTSKKEILRNSVKFYAEDCKIQMSFKESYNILTNLGELPFEDENGEEPSLDINITQETMQNVVGPIFQKAINICKDLLKRNNLKGSQLTTLLLVGGPTYSPVLRKMLKEQITDKVNTSIDPITCVATGAASFASTISISEQVIEQTRDKTKIQLDVKYEATTVELDEMVSLKILKDKTIGTIPDKVFAIISRGDKAWASGKKQITERATLFDVQLNAGASNSFEISIYDEQGNNLDSQPNTFNILQGFNVGQATLPYYIGIEIFDSVLEQDVFMPINGLEKNKEIPPNGLTGVYNSLKTQKPIRPGIAADSIVIPIYQGDYNAKHTRAIYSEHIFDVIISGEDIPALLPEGSDVEITLKINRSEGATLSAFFPYLNHTEEIPVKFETKSALDANSIRNEIVKAKRQAEKVNAQQIKAELKVVEEKLENKGGSDAGRLEVLSNLREQLRHLDKVTEETEWSRVEKELKENYYRLEDLIDRVKANDEDERINWNMVNANKEELNGKIEKLVKNPDVYEGKAVLDDLNGLIHTLIRIAAGAALLMRWIKEFDDEFNDIQWKDRNKARTIINKGLQMIPNNPSEEQLENVLSQVRDEMATTPENEERKMKLTNR